MDSLQAALRYFGHVVRQERGIENNVMPWGNEWEEKARKTKANITIDEQHETRETNGYCRNGT